MANVSTTPPQPKTTATITTTLSLLPQSIRRKIRIRIFYGIEKKIKKF
jgi:hypothetical protein